MNEQNQLNDMRRILQEVRDYQPVQVPCRAVIMDGTNFPRWKRDMTLYLKESDLWEIVTSPVPEEPDQVWRRKNNKALSDIHNTCKEDQQDLIMDAETAKEAWDNLVTKYEAKTPGMINRLLNEFSLATKGNSETCTQYITRVKALARQLTAVGEKVSEERLLNKILQGLPRQYGQLRMTVALQNEVDQEKVIDAIVGEERRMKNEKEREANEDGSRGRRVQWGGSRSSPRQRSRSTSRFRSTRRRSRSTSPHDRGSIRCGYCGKRGHDKADCWERKTCEGCNRKGHIKDVCWVLHPEKRLKGPREERPRPALRAQVTTTDQQKEQLQIEPAYPGAPTN